MVLLALILTIATIGHQYVNAALDPDVAILKEAIIGLQSELSELRKVVNQNNNNNAVPIGFIYAQLPNEKSPTEIWPWMTWNDVSATYAGVFFRVMGGEAAAFGQVQQNNSPHLIRVNTTYGEHDNNAELSVNTVVGGKSVFLETGDWTIDETRVRSFQFELSGGEVRPRNMATRIWKRAG